MQTENSAEEESKKEKSETGREQEKKNSFSLPSLDFTIREIFSSELDNSHSCKTKAEREKQESSPKREREVQKEEREEEKDWAFKTSFEYSPAL